MSGNLDKYFKESGEILIARKSGKTNITRRKVEELIDILSNYECLKSNVYHMSETEYAELDNSVKNSPYCERYKTSSGVGIEIRIKN